MPSPVLVKLSLTGPIFLLRRNLQLPMNAPYRWPDKGDGKELVTMADQQDHKTGECGVARRTVHVDHQQGLVLFVIRAPADPRGEGRRMGTRHRQAQPAGSRRRLGPGTMGVFDRRKATDYVSVKVVISFQALPGKAAELLPLLKDGRDISRAAEGCESFELFQRQDDENKFMFLEGPSQEHGRQRRGHGAPHADPALDRRATRQGSHPDGRLNRWWSGWPATPSK
jgi:hypothetical protein